VVFRDDRGRVLSVRKRGTDRFMLPGGKPEPGESPADAAAREVAEELGVVVPVEELVLLGRFEAAAANEPGHTVRSTVFTPPGRSPRPPRPRSPSCAGPPSTSWRTTRPSRS
jgi:8-oxo-dGTP diphosphatase